MKRRRTFAELVVESLAVGWFTGREKEKHWGVYEQAENVFYSVNPPTLRNARREQRLSGTGSRVMPYVVAREVMNAYNHGRDAGRREEQRKAAA